MNNVSMIKFTLFYGNSEIFHLKLDNGSTAECRLSSRVKLNLETVYILREEMHTENNIPT